MKRRALILAAAPALLVACSREMFLVLFAVDGPATRQFLVVLNAFASQHDYHRVSTGREPADDPIEVTFRGHETELAISRAETGVGYEAWFTYRSDVLFVSDDLRPVVEEFRQRISRVDGVRVED